MRTVKVQNLTGAVVGVTLLAAASQSALAAPVLNPDNGHYYDYITTTMTWDQARADAATRTYLGNQGYIASVTSLTEAQFINSAFITGKMAGTHTGPWVGAWQRSQNSGPLNDWYWSSGEPFSFGEWAAGEPNDWKAVDENGIHFMRELGWNDRPRNMAVNGYIVEYGAPEGYTLANPAPSGELSIDGPGGIIEQLQLMDNISLARVSDGLDAKWSLNPGSNPTRFRARFSPINIQFGLMPGLDTCAPESFIPLMNSPASDGLMSSGSAPSVDVSGAIPPGQPTQLAILAEDGILWCSSQALNGDGADHMLTWVDPNDPDHYVVSFEIDEFLGLSPGDYNDFVVELDNVLDGPIDAISEPDTLALFGLGLAAAYYRRRRSRG
jgi:hypothetical protein